MRREEFVEVSVAAVITRASLVGGVTLLVALLSKGWGRVGFLLLAAALVAAVAFGSPPRTIWVQGDRMGVVDGCARSELRAGDVSTVRLDRVRWMGEVLVLEGSRGESLTFMDLSARSAEVRAAAGRAILAADGGAVVPAELRKFLGIDPGF